MISVSYITICFFYKYALPYIFTTDIVCIRRLTTVLSTSSGKTFFAWRFILNENILFWLTIFYQKPFVFSVSVFCSQICTLKLNLSPKIGLTYAISIVKWFFGIFVLVNIFYFSLLDLKYWCFRTIVWKIRKIEQVKLIENLPPSYLPHKFLHNFHSFLLWEKVKILDFLKTTD